MAVYVSDLLTAIPAPVDVAPASAQTWQWLRSSTAISGATGGTYTTTLADLGTTLAVTQTETNFLGAASATSANTEVVQAYDPNALFRFSEPGVWFDPNDITTLYKGPTNVTQVTAPGDTVYLMLDKSRGGPGPELVVNGSFATGTISGWTNTNAAVSVSNGIAYISALSVANRQSIWQTFTTVIGTTYRLAYQIISGGGGNTNVYVGTSYASSVNASGPTTVGSNALVFTATATTTFLTVGVWTTGETLAVTGISIKSVIGNHATQPTLASQPTYGIVPAGGRRNLLEQSEAFNEAIWVKATGGIGVTPVVTANAGTDPIGGSTADRVQFSLSGGTASSDISQLRQTVQTSNGPTYTFSFWARSFDGLSSYQIISFGAPPPAQAIAITGTWTRFTVTGIGPNINYSLALRGGQAPVNSNTADILLWGAQLEQSTIATPYQRVGTTYDVTEAGVPSLGYLQFNGINNSMATPTITPGIDKAQIFAGVRKFTDATVGMVAELSVSVTTNAGSFYLTAPETTGVGGDFSFKTRGSVNPGAFASSGPVLAPTTRVLTGLGDIPADLATLRVNGGTPINYVADQGTGNFLAYPLYLGARGGSSIFFNGQLFPLIVRFGTNLTAARITATENWMATQTPLQWTVGSGFWNDAYPWSDISAWRD